MGKTRETGTEARYMFQINWNNNKYNTGLDEKIPNPYLDLNPDFVMNEYGLPAIWRDEVEKIVKQKEITKQTYYEIKFGTDPNYLTSNFNPESSVFRFTPGKEANVRARSYSYIETFYITLYDRANRFTDETLRQAIAIQLIKNHSKIAADKKTLNPVAHHYYVSEENEAEMEKMRKQDVIDRATYEKFKLQNEASEFKNYQVASMCTTVDFKPIVKGSATKEQVKIALNNYLADGRDQLRNIDKFLSIVDLTKNPESKDMFEVKYLIAQCYANDILTRRDGYTFWKSKSNDQSKYKWTSDDAFVSFIISEYNSYNPQEDTKNWWKDLYDEASKKDIWLD